MVSTPLSSETAGDLCYELDFTYDDCDALWELSEESQDRSKALTVGGGEWVQMGEERGCATDAEMMFTAPNVVADTLIYDIYGGGK